MRRRPSTIVAALAAALLATGAAAEDADNVFSTPAPFQPKPEPAPAAPMRGPFASLRDGRGVLEASHQIALRRLPDGPAAHPITKSITPYDNWKVACESRGEDAACFAAAYAAFEGIVLKVKFGLAAAPSDDDAANPEEAKGDETKNDDAKKDAKADKPTPPKKADAKKPDAKAAAKAPRAAPAPRYVVEFEGPPGLDTDTGYSIVAPRAVGFLSLEQGCDRAACRATAELSRDLAPILDPEATERSGFAVIASANGRAFMWRFPLGGLREAFDQVRKQSLKTVVAEAPAKAPPPKGAAKPTKGRAEIAAGSEEEKKALTPTSRPVRIVPVKGARKARREPAPRPAAAKRKPHAGSRSDHFVPGQE